MEDVNSGLTHFSLCLSQLSACLSCSRLFTRHHFSPGILPVCAPGEVWASLPVSSPRTCHGEGTQWQLLKEQGKLE